MLLTATADDDRRLLTVPAPRRRTLDTAGRTDGTARLTWRASKSLDRVVRCEAVSANEDTDHDA